MEKNPGKATVLETGYVTGIYLEDYTSTATIVPRTVSSSDCCKTWKQYVYDNLNI